MLVSAILLVLGIAQEPSSPTAPTRQQLAERFVAAATPEAAPSVDDGNDPMEQELLQANPGREADVRRIVREMSNCIGHDGDAAMRQAGIEAALAFESEQLERLIAFVEMRNSTRKDGASSRTPPGWEAARRDYGRWMYSVGGQPAALALAKRCEDAMTASMTAAGLRY